MNRKHVVAASQVRAFIRTGQSATGERRGDTSSSHTHAGNQGAGGKGWDPFIHTTVQISDDRCLKTYERC